MFRVLSQQAFRVHKGKGRPSQQIECALVSQPTRHYLTKYPFYEMAIGSSFKIDGEIRPNVASAANKYGKKWGIKFSVFMGNNGDYFCERIK